MQDLLPESFELAQVGSNLLLLLQPCIVYLDAICANKWSCYLNHSINSFYLLEIDNKNLISRYTQQMRQKTEECDVRKIKN